MLSSTSLHTPVPPPRGVMVPCPTFFKKDTTSSSFSRPLDIEAQVAHSIHLASSGIVGLVLLGSTGEAVHVSNDERKTLIKGVRDALNEADFPDYCIIAGTAQNSIEETVIQCKISAEAGAQYALVLSPSFFATAGGYTDEGLIMWYSAVADQSPIPILIYNYPAVTNNLTIPPTVYRTLSNHRNIVGCKLSHFNMAYHIIISSIPSETFHAYTGLGQQLLPFMLGARGAGAIDGLAGFFPKTVVRLYNLGRQVEEKGTKEVWEEARNLQSLVSQGEEWVVKFGTLGIKEATSRVLGIGKGDGGRLPFCGLKPEVVDKAYKEFEPLWMQLQDVESGL